MAEKVVAKWCHEPRALDELPALPTEAAAAAASDVVQLHEFGRQRATYTRFDLLQLGSASGRVPTPYTTGQVGGRAGSRLLHACCH